MDNLCNVTTGKVRFSYVHLYKPYAYQQGQEEKYQATVLVPKSDVDTKARIDAAIEAAKQKGTAEKWNGVCPPIVSNPVYDGDGVRPSDGMAFGPECKGHWVFTASAKADYPPEIVDSMGNPIINQSEVYSGMIWSSQRNFFPVYVWWKERNRMRTWSGAETGGRGSTRWKRTKSIHSVWNRCTANRWSRDW